MIASIPWLQSSLYFFLAVKYTYRSVREESTVQAVIVCVLCSDSIPGTFVM